MTDKMMTNIARIVSMLCIWVGFIVVAALTLSPAGNIRGSDATAIIVFLGIAAAVASGAVWRGASSDESPRHMIQSTGKAKRDARNRLSQMVDSLSDDEAADLLNDLRGRLSSSGESDGEITSLEALLSERDSRRR